MTERSITYSTVDVFTRERFRGNPVAVIHDASGLDTVQMQAVAQEFGYSETTFVLPPHDDRTAARVRIFTPHDEVPFAGHPNIGTTFVMADGKTAARDPLPEVVVLDELGGPVRAELLREDERVVGAEILAPKALEIIGEVETTHMARCLGLGIEQLVDDRFAPCVVSVGLPFAFVELRSLDALAAIDTDVAAFRKAANVGPRTVDDFAICAFVVTEEGGTRTAIRSRVFSPLGHPPEDPATGSAAGALVALLARTGDGGAQRYAVTQGVEMGRPSKIEVDMCRLGDPPRIRGYCTKVSRGTMDV